MQATVIKKSMEALPLAVLCTLVTGMGPVASVLDCIPAAYHNTFAESWMERAPPQPVISPKVPVQQEFCGC